MGIEWTNNMDFEAVKDQIRARRPVAIARGLEHIRSVVVPLVPVASGHLVGSVGVTVGDDMGEITVPGPYALYQHEGIYFRHGRYGAPLRHNHGESFFLERPMITEADKVIQIVADALLGDS